MKIIKNVSFLIMVILTILAGGTFYLGYYLNIHTWRATPEARELDKVQHNYSIIDSIIVEETKDPSVLVELFQASQGLVTQISLDQPLPVAAENLCRTVNGGRASTSPLMRQRRQGLIAGLLTISMVVPVMGSGFSMVLISPWRRLRRRTREMIKKSVGGDLGLAKIDVCRLQGKMASKDHGVPGIMSGTVGRLSPAPM